MKKDTIEQPNTAGQRTVRINDIVEIYKDPITEEHLEGHARVWEIMSETDEFYSLIVSFMADPHGRRVLREYRKNNSK